jgi:hypothetical protein
VGAGEGGLEISGMILRYGGQSSQEDKSKTA